MEQNQSEHVALRRMLGDTLGKVSGISQDSVDQYEACEQKLLLHVNQMLESDPRCHELIGNSPLHVMHSNHLHHFKFLTTVMRERFYSELLTTIPWVLHAYQSQGFQLEYFRLELTSWRDAVAEHLPVDAAAEIIPLYEWMFNQLDDLDMLSHEEAQNSLTRSSAAHWEQLQLDFFDAVLKPDTKRTMELAFQNIKSPDDLRRFYQEVIDPTMVRIGDLWQQGVLTVAHEHLASALVSRTMSSSIFTQFALQPITKAKALVATVTHEHHEIGANMFADFLTSDGWEVLYLGANPPIDSLVAMLKEHDCFLLGISVSMLFSLPTLRAMIEMVRTHSSAKILLGGKAFLHQPDYWREIGADGFATNAQEGMELAALWWEQAGEQSHGTGE